ncbi:hypothetical protein BpHYR1_028814 [Brachionus plicatilis]|uniref:Uncharacterized protein n=1 Tax=Brachionus plicatilis TaxID=10195 RepID=A0A3M7PCQ4_BRAPC|nr:hypothetical protein BpHYR1_028814 [Brachionus plicatilis]
MVRFLYKRRAFLTFFPFLKCWTASCLNSLGLAITKKLEYSLIKLQLNHPKKEKQFQALIRGYAKSNGTSDLLNSSRTQFTHIIVIGFH